LFGLGAARIKRNRRYKNRIIWMYPLGVPYFGLPFHLFTEEEERELLEEEARALEDQLLLVRKRLARLKQQEDKNSDSLDYIASQESE